jgi:flavin-dependent dehydrogenase
MRIYRNGYGGLADLGNGMANLCLVANRGAMKELRKEAELRHPTAAAAAWRSVTPISRPKARLLALDGVFLCGDAARVVEPFTGEGIAYALRGGELLGDLLCAGKHDSETLLRSQADLYMHAHRNLYGKSGSLWINTLTRFLSANPRVAHLLSPILIRHPSLLSKHTSKVMRKSSCSATNNS